MTAILASQLSVTELVAALRRGDELDCRETTSDGTVLHRILDAGIPLNDALVRTTILCGCNVNYRDRFLRTAYGAALTARDMASMCALIRAGANDYDTMFDASGNSTDEYLLMWEPAIERSLLRAAIVDREESDFLKMLNPMLGQE